MVNLLKKLCDNWRNRTFVFIMLQVTAIISMMDVELSALVIERKTRSVFIQRPEAILILNFDTHELLLSPVYSLCALSLIYYGYGAVYLRTRAPFNGFRQRLCQASMLLWRRLSHIMILPWLMLVLQGILPYPERIWNCLFTENKREINHFYAMASFAFFFWIMSILVIIWTLLMVMRSNRKLIQSTQIEANEFFEIRAYAHAINESLGFHLVDINAL